MTIKTNILILQSYLATLKPHNTDGAAVVDVADPDGNQLQRGFAGWNRLSQTDSDGPSFRLSVIHRPVEKVADRLLSAPRNKADIAAMTQQVAEKTKQALRELKIRTHLFRKLEEIFNVRKHLYDLIEDNNASDTFMSAQRHWELLSQTSQMLRVCRQIFQIVNVGLKHNQNDPLLVKARESILTTSELTLRYAKSLAEFEPLTIPDFKTHTQITAGYVRSMAKDVSLMIDIEEHDHWKEVLKALEDVLV